MDAEHIINGSNLSMESIARNRRNQGFTLIELLVVIVLLAILSSFTMMRFSKTMVPTSEAENIAGLIRFTQSLSMSHGGGYYFVISPPTHYFIKNNSGTAIYIPDTNSNTGTLPTNYAIANWVNMNGQAIYFDGMGIPHNVSYSNLLYNQLLTSQASFQLTYTGGATRTITISPVTGYVQVQ